MANDVLSFRSRVHEVPFTITGAIGDVIVSANWNDILDQEGYMNGYNSVYEGFGNHVKVEMTSADSGKIIVTQEVGKYIFSDEEYFVKYFASDINVIATDEAGRTSQHNIHLGYENVYADSFWPCDDFTFEFVDGYPTITLPSGSPAVDEEMWFSFNCEGADFDAEDSLMSIDPSTLFHGSSYIYGGGHTDFPVTLQKSSKHGFNVSFPIKLDANNSGQDKTTSYQLYKYDRYEEHGSVAMVLWDLKIIQKK